jgi:segregation and condensation protein B
VSTGNNQSPSSESTGGPSPFSEEEVASVTAGPMGDPEVEELEAAEIDAPEQETPFEKIVAKSKRLGDAQIRNVIESILFVAPAPLSVDQLYESTGIDREKIEESLSKLQGKRRDGLSGVVLHEVAGGWQFRSAVESADYVRRFLKVKPQRLTRAALETLAIIAYRQPVTRPEVEDIRGVDSGAVLKALLDRRLIKIVGKKDEVGRPILYGTSREFLEFFALKNLSALPTLREFHELTEESQEIVEKETPQGPLAPLAELSDNSLQAVLEKSQGASEAALEALEKAMDTAEVTAKSVAQVFVEKHSLPVQTGEAPGGTRDAEPAPTVGPSKSEHS